MVHNIELTLKTITYIFVWLIRVLRRESLRISTELKSFHHSETGISLSSLISLGVVRHL